jgi:K+-transporting ATPase ATPase B chain
LSSAILKAAVRDSVLKLDPRVQIRNPVMFLVWVGAALTSVLAVQAPVGTGEARFGFVLSVALWLWATVLFANFAEAVAEGRGKAQAATLRATRRDVVAKRLAEPRRDARVERAPATQLKKGE